MFTVYVLYSPTHDKIYIGYTSNFEQRFLSHNELGKKGYTVKYRPWEIAHTEVFATKADAAAREKSLKTAAGRRFVWEKIR
jgi:putative endonuclease